MILCASKKNIFDPSMYGTSLEEVMEAQSRFAEGLLPKKFTLELWRVLWFEYYLTDCFGSSSSPRRPKYMTLPAIYLFSDFRLQLSIQCNRVGDSMDCDLPDGCNFDRRWCSNRRDFPVRTHCKVGHAYSDALSIF